MRQFDLAPEKVRDELADILRQPEFLSSPNVAGFLRYIVEETLAGRSSRLKAFTIATAVLGRDDSFDPQTNPIVRVEALRLRRMLERHYTGVGLNSAIHIRLRPGSYVPEFVAGEVPAPPMAPPEPDPPKPAEPLQEPPSARPWPSRTIGLAAAAAGLAVAACLVLVLLPGAHVPAEPPAVTPASLPSSAIHATMQVGPIRYAKNTPEIRDLADRLTTRIEDAISRFDNPRIIHDQDGSSDYQVTGLLSAPMDGVVDLSFRVLHVPSKEIIWTHQADKIRLDAPDPASRESMDLIASRVAQTNGAVFSDMYNRLPSNIDEMNGYGCIILAYGILNAPRSGSLPRAQACLERAIAAHRGYSSAYAALALLWTARYLNGIEPPDGPSALERGRDAANTAVSLAPHKSRPHAALFWTRFLGGRFDDAFESARIALELNPFATDTIGRVGAARLLRGDADVGRTLLRRSQQNAYVPPGWLEFFLFFDAWLQGDKTLAKRHALRHTGSQHPLGMLARAIVSHEEGDDAAATAWSERLGVDYPEFARDVPAGLDRLKMMVEPRDRLLAAAERAGVPRVRPSR